MSNKLPRLTAKEAERILFNDGFIFIRQKGSHRIYRKGRHRMILPFHRGKTLHPKIVEEIYEVLENSRSENSQGHNER